MNQTNKGMNKQRFIPFTVIVWCPERPDTTSTRWNGQEYKAHFLTALNKTTRKFQKRIEWAEKFMVIDFKARFLY